MKKVESIVMIAVLLFLVTNSNAQERDMKVYYKNGTTLQVPVSKIDSIKFVPSTGNEGVVINGVTWATRNVNMPGTFAAKPEDAGMFYQWNKKVGWSSKDPMVNSDGGTVWDTSSATGSVWYPTTNPCPAGWRVPTSDELGSLEQSGNEWTTLNGVTGRVFGSGNATLFLPAAGERYRSDGHLMNVGSRGRYWSNNGATDLPRLLSFTSTDVGVTNSFTYRDNGYSVRCVAE